MPGTPRLRQSGPRRTGVDHHHHHHRSRVTRPSVQARRCSGWLAQGSFSSGPLQRQSTDQADRHWQAVAGSGSSGGGKTQQMLGNPTIKSAEQMCTLPTPIEPDRPKPPDSWSGILRRILSVGAKCVEPGFEDPLSLPSCSVMLCVPLCPALSRLAGLPAYLKNSAALSGLVSVPFLSYSFFKKPILLCSSVSSLLIFIPSLPTPRA